MFIKLLPYTVFEKNIYPWKWQAREPALCQLYRHTFDSYVCAVNDEDQLVIFFSSLSTFQWYDAVDLATERASMQPFTFMCFLMHEENEIRKVSLVEVIVGQLSLASLRGCLIDYQLRLG